MCDLASIVHEGAAASRFPVAPQPPRYTVFWRSAIGSRRARAARAEGLSGLHANSRLALSCQGMGALNFDAGASGWCWQVTLDQRSFHKDNSWAADIVGLACDTVCRRLVMSESGQRIQASNCFQVRALSATQQQWLLWSSFLDEILSQFAGTLTGYPSRSICLLDAFVPERWTGRPSCGARA